MVISSQNNDPKYLTKGQVNKTFSCRLVRYFGTLFWDDITIFWDENLL